MEKLSHSPHQFEVLRACDELRRGYPVLLDGFILTALETLDAARLAYFDQKATQSQILLSAGRATTLKIDTGGKKGIYLQRAAGMTADFLRALGDPSLDLEAPFKGPFYGVAAPESEAEALKSEAALKLMKIARLLPALLINREITQSDSDILSVSSADILAHDMASVYNLRQVARAKLPLLGAETTEIVAFRPDMGGLEHLALLIGDPCPHTIPLVRLHSECFTGDLLASLKCDCGDQLRGAVKGIAEAGGGILLYLAQEGRGIGLIAKLKAYRLQDEGYDTVEANERLGFEVDERVFALAGEMLHQLGFKKINLMTNNPLKIKALEASGIDVVARVAHQFAANPHNAGYLAVKKARTGHLLTDENEQD